MTTHSEAAASRGAAVSPDDLLKAVVSGANVSGTKTPPAAIAPAPRIGRAPWAVGLVGVALGTLVGAGGAVLTMGGPDRASTILADMAAGLEAQRTNADRASAELDRLGTALAALKAASEAAQGQAKLRGTELAGAVSRAEHGLATKMTALTERLDQIDREQNARIAALAAQVDKRAVPVAVAVAPKVEPAVTGSIPEAKSKPAVIEGWAVRDVYAGTAMLEDRRRRLLEVSVGDAIPGVGRVEGVERRGREWIVVTRQGIVTPQPW